MWRKVVRVVAFVLAAVAVWFFVGSCRLSSRLKAAENQVLMCMPADLAKPGAWRGQYRKTITCDHADLLTLEVTPPFSSAEEARKALAGISGEVVFRDASGKVVCSSDLDARVDEGGEIRLALVHLPAGAFDVDLRVVSPATGVAGRTTKLYGRYMFCGLERWPVLLGYGLGVLGVILTSLAFGLSFLGRRKIEEPPRNQESRSS